MLSSKTAKAHPHAYLSKLLLLARSLSALLSASCVAKRTIIQCSVVLSLTLSLLIGVQTLQDIEQIAPQSQYGQVLATQVIFSSVEQNHL